MFAFIIAMSVSFASYASSNPTGERLLTECLTAVKFIDGKPHTVDTDSSYSIGWCVGFLQGIESSNTGDNDCKYSIPSDVTMYQKTLVVLKFLEANPNKLYLPAVSLVENAFSESFPCKSKTS